MDSVGNIDRYLRAQLAAERKSGARSEQSGLRPFVTISRQSGTGARLLADVILEAFARQDDADTFDGWQVYDKKLCEIVAKEPRFAKSLDSLLEEEYRSKTSDFFNQVLGSGVGQNMLMDRVFLVVRTVARMGNAIIVGRGGSHVTKGMAQGAALRLVAPEDSRIARLMEILDVPEKEAQALAHKRDADRARLIKAHFGADIADPEGYDMTWNTGTASFEEISEAVVVLVRNRAHAE